MVGSQEKQASTNVTGMKYCVTGLVVMINVFQSLVLNFIIMFSSCIFLVISLLISFVCFSHSQSFFTVNSPDTPTPVCQVSLYSSALVLSTCSQVERCVSLHHVCSPSCCPCSTRVFPFYIPVVSCHIACLFLINTLRFYFISSFTCQSAFLVHPLKLR